MNATPWKTISLNETTTGITKRAPNRYAQVSDAVALSAPSLETAPQGLTAANTNASRSDGLPATQTSGQATPNASVQTKDVQIKGVK